MSTVLISGADSFTGRYLAAALHQAGHEVHGIVKQEIADSIHGIKALHVADLSDTAALNAVVLAVRPQKVVHLAAVTFVAHSEVDAIYATNVMGTRNLLEALTFSRMPLQSILLASSANLYGNATAGVLDETTPPAPNNDYAVSKLAMEYVARLYTNRLPITITRPFNYTGVGQAETFLIPKIVAHVRKCAPMITLGNLDVARDFSDVRTVVEVYQRLLDIPAAIGQTFNVCSGHAWTLNDILNEVRSLSGHHFEVCTNPAFVRKNEVKILIGNPVKLQATIGLLPKISLRETLRWMLEA